MRSLSVSVGAAILSGLIVAGAWARADEQKIPLDQVPKAVMDTVKAKFPAAEFKEAVKETADGKTSYEVSLTVKNAKVDVILTSEGKITAVEKVITEADLRGAELRNVDLAGADLTRATLLRSTLQATSLDRAMLGDTVMSDGTRRP